MVKEQAMCVSAVSELEGGRWDLASATWSWSAVPLICTAPIYKVEERVQIEERHFNLQTPELEVIYT
jgi:hypothetical protein